MSAIPCPQCGAIFLPDDASCASRFEVLLGLDLSRQEPWGSRHGQAFAAFALQHPASYPQSLDHAWAALYQIYSAHAHPAYVFNTLRALGNSNLPSAWAVPARPIVRQSVPTVTLADFAADIDPVQLDAWCHATLVSWGLNLAQRPA